MGPLFFLSLADAPRGKRRGAYAAAAFSWPRLEPLGDRGPVYAHVDVLNVYFCKYMFKLEKFNLDRINEK